MPKVNGESLLASRERVYLTLRRHPMGLKEVELAEIMELDRRTLNNYLRALETEGKIYKDGLLWTPLPFDQAQLRKLEMSPEEAMMLYLAARLFVKQNDKQNEPAQTALMKLAAALVGDAKVGNEIHQAALELSRRPDDGAYNRIFRTMMQAYIYRRVVHLEYQPAGGKLFATDFEPYLLEPSAIGFTTYAIGKSSIVNDLRTYKLERIRSAALTRQEYSIPSSFPGLEILRNAWSIIHGDELVTVTLRFSPAVRERVMETRWHFSENKQNDAEKPGYLVWRAQVADTIDMLPWVRGWGSDVEVLEPKELRNALEKEVRKLTKVYRVREIESKDELIAHRREKDGEEQSLIVHLTETSEWAKRFAAKVGLPEIGKTMGLLHDFGKASKEYQSYLRTKEGLISPGEEGYSHAERGEIDHSTAGAQLLYEKLSSRGQEAKVLAQFLSLAIASHHSGLIDCLKPDGKNEFHRRITKDDIDTHVVEVRSKLSDIEKQLDEILAQPIEKHFYQIAFETMAEANDSKETRWFKRGLLARFLLSCLLDADRLSTADFENPGNETIRNYGKYIPWDILIERLEEKFAEFARSTDGMKAGSQALKVNQLRGQVAQACLDFATKPKGIYQLTVPTGGGKTLASLRFALHHAQKHKMDRVFYIVPYITIIDQNAKDVRKVLKDVDEKDKPLDKIVLEHHSNFVPSDDTRRRHNLLAENWDAPLVFTTQVQFLEALFGSGTRDPRRMHQLANSVIILDEVQTVPIKIVHMLNAALRFLAHDCGSTIVLCTATQPPLDNLPENPYRALTIMPEQKIIQNEAELFEKLKRVQVHDERKPGGSTNLEIVDLAERALREKGSVLLVVNTRASAQVLYQQIKARNLAATYHLSTNMCPAHRMDVLDEIKVKLKANQPVICVSTQLIEAGVDIDFGAVIRALVGLDSIAQSAGRCNRHGVREGLGSVWVVNPEEENLTRLPDIKIGRGYAQTVLDDFRDNPDAFGNDRIGLDAVAAYYNLYYQSQKDKMNYPVNKDSSVGRDDNLFNLLSLNDLSTKAYEAIHHSAPDILLRSSFRTASGEFRVIDSPTRGVIVPYEDGEKVITELCGSFGLEKQGKLLKQAQRYSVNLFEYQFKKLFEAGAIKEVQPETGIYHLNEQYYSKAFGWSDEPVSDTTVRIV